MNPLHHISRIPRPTWILPLLLLIGCPSEKDSHEGHNHKTGQEHEDLQEGESIDEHAGHDHDEESSK